MEEILHHPGWLKPCKSWENHHPWWRRFFFPSTVLTKFPLQPHFAIHLFYWRIFLQNQKEADVAFSSGKKRLWKFPWRFGRSSSFQNGWFVGSVPMFHVITFLGVGFVVHPLSPSFTIPRFQLNLQWIAELSVDREGHLRWEKTFIKMSRS